LLEEIKVRDVAREKDTAVSAHTKEDERVVQKPLRHSNAMRGVSGLGHEVGVAALLEIQIEDRLAGRAPARPGVPWRIRCFTQIRQMIWSNSSDDMV
jgi:hypothetical protein